SQPIPEVSHVAGGSDSRTPLPQGCARTKARLPRRASASATNRSDELSVRGDKNSTMICRKKLHDDLSVRRIQRGPGVDGESSLGPPAGSAAALVKGGVADGPGVRADPAEHVVPGAAVALASRLEFDRHRGRGLSPRPCGTAGSQTPAQAVPVVNQ